MGGKVQLLFSGFVCLFDTCPRVVVGKQSANTRQGAALHFYRTLEMPPHPLRLYFSSDSFCGHVANILAIGMQYIVPSETWI